MKRILELIITLIAFILLIAEIEKISIMIIYIKVISLLWIYLLLKRKELI